MVPPTTLGLSFSGFKFLTSKLKKYSRLWPQYRGLRASTLCTIVFTIISHITRLFQSLVIPFFPNFLPYVFRLCSHVEGFSLFLGWVSGMSQSHFRHLSIQKVERVEQICIKSRTFSVSLASLNLFSIIS